MRWVRSLITITTTKYCWATPSLTVNHSLPTAATLVRRSLSITLQLLPQQKISPPPGAYQRHGSFEVLAHPSTVNRCQSACDVRKYMEQLQRWLRINGFRRALLTEIVAEWTFVLANQAIRRQSAELTAQ